MSQGERKFQLVVYGSTGYTGQLACVFLAKEYGLPSASFNYAVSGRSEAQLKNVAKAMVKAVKGTDSDLSKIPTIVASPTDVSSMESMVKQTKAVVSFAGPYTLCGEPLIKACAEAGTHYVDVTGEMEWVLKMRELYDGVAKASKAKIVPSCGVMALPNEIAMMYTHQMCTQRRLKMNSVTQVEEAAPATLSGGTMRSALVMLKGLSLSECMARFKDPYRLCSIKPSEEVAKKSKSCCCNLRYSSDAGAWVAPSPVGNALSATLRWSNEVQGHVWGNDVVMKVMVAHQAFWRAALAIILAFFIPFFTWAAAQLPIQKFVPSPGKLVMDGGSDNGYLKIFTTAETTHAESSAKKVLTCKLECPHAVYILSGMLACEAALSLVEGLDREKYGVSSPSDLVGLNVLQRLEKRGCRASFLAVVPR